MNNQEKNEMKNTMEQTYQIHSFKSGIEIYVVNHSDIVFSVNVKGTGETHMFDNDNDAVDFAKSLFKIKTEEYLEY